MLYCIYIFSDARIDILKEGTDFKGIFFTCEDMAIQMRSFQNIIFHDMTYKLFNNKLIFGLFLIEDSNFLTDIVAVTVVVNEDQETFNWIFKCFREHYEPFLCSCKYFMSDKNASQRNAAKMYLPRITLRLCKFHTLENFNFKFQYIIEIYRKGERKKFISFTSNGTL